MKLLFLLFLSIPIHNQVIMETGQLEQLNQAITPTPEEPRTLLNQKRKQSICNLSFIKIMLNNPELPDKMNAIITNKFTKESCPDMKKSCCDPKQIKYLFEQVKQSYPRYKTTMKEMRSFIAFLSSLTDERLDRFEKRQRTELSKCQEPQQSFVELIKELRQKSLEIHDLYIDYLHDVINNKYELICGLCSFKNNLFFTVDTKKNKMYQINLKSPEEVFYVSQNQLNLHKMNDLDKLMSFIKCYYFGLAKEDNNEVMERSKALVKIVEQQDWSGLSSSKDLLEDFMNEYVPGASKFIDFKMLETLVTEIIDEDDRTIKGYKPLTYRINIFSVDKDVSMYKQLEPKNISVRLKNSGFNIKDNRFIGKGMLREFDEFIQYKKHVSLLSSILVILFFVIN